MAGEPRKPGGKRKPVPGEEHLTTRPGSPYWHYGFSIDGARFRGSCGTADYDQAAAFAAARFSEEFDRIRLGIAPRQHITLNDAFARYYLEVGKGTSYGDSAQRHQMKRMLAILGRDLRLADLNDARVNDLVQVMRTTPLEAPDKAQKRFARLKVVAKLRAEGKTHRQVAAAIGVGEEQARKLAYQAEQMEAGTLKHRRGEAASPATINRYLFTLSAVCSRARDVWKVEVGDWDRKKHMQDEGPGQAVYLTPDTARVVLREATAHIRPLMMLDVMVGMRKGNMVNLRWEEITLHGEEPKIVTIGKGNRVYSVALPPLAVRLLESLQPDPAMRKGRVFYYGNPHVPCTCATCRRADMRGKAFVDPKKSIKTAFRRAGLPPETRFHDLRHTFASWLLNNGGTLKDVQEALNHQNIQTTMRYVHLEAGRKASLIAKATGALFTEPAPAAEVIPLPSAKKDSEAA